MTITLKLEKWDQETNTWKDEGKSLTLDSTKTSGKFEGLDKNKKYRVVEQEVNGWVPNYSHDKNGDLVIKNKKNPNPNPITPPEVTVTSGGYRFVKTDDNNTDIKRLAGGKFLIKNKENKYLYYKSEANKTNDLKTLKDLEDQLQDKVVAYNKLSAEEQKNAQNQTIKDMNDLVAKIKVAKQNANIQYEWKDGFGTKDKLNANIVVLTPDNNGYMEITGLDFGDYTLHEVIAPEGYAIPSDGQKFPFTVNAKSYSELKIMKKDAPTEEDKTATIASSDSDETKAQRLVNKKVTIPQTGGMGTVLFTVVGISLMAGAVLAMKKNREEA